MSATLSEGEEVGWYLTPWEAKVYVIKEAVLNGH
jgi:hypothetical protein